MPVNFIDLQAQYLEVKEDIDARFAEIFANNAYVMGKNNTELEERVAKRHKVKHAIAVNSGTDALRIAMQACDIKPGDEVITTAFTFVATVETIVQIGAIPVFVDIDPNTYNINPDLIESAITPKTKAILPIHLFGQLADMDAITKIAKKHNLEILEDSAQVIHSSQNGVYTGNFGKAAGISFYVTKNLGAAGDGGLILTNDPEVDRRSRSLRIHGMGRERYYYDEVGYTSRMAELQAAVLCAKLDRLDDWHARKKEVANIYLQELKNSPAKLPTTLPGNDHVWHQFTITHPHRDQLMAHLKENGIPSAIFYPVPLHLHDPYKEFAPTKGTLKVTEDVSNHCLSLPVHQHMTDDQVLEVANAIKSFSP